MMDMIRKIGLLALALGVLAGCESTAGMTQEEIRARWDAVNMRNIGSVGYKPAPQNSEED